MSFSDFKEVNINNPGTATVYGADDILELMRIFNAQIVSNRQVKIKNPWQFQDNYDVVAAAVVPPNPGANTKRFYVDPADNHFKMRSPAGVVVDFDVLGQGSIGEANIGQNVGTGGQGFYKQKTSVTLEFRNLNVASNKLSIALDSGNNEIDLDVNETNLTHNNIGGILGVTKGGTGLNTITSQAIMKGAGTSNVALINPGTDGQILTMVTGAPAWAAQSGSTDIKVAVYEAGTQVGSVGRKLNFPNADDLTITEDGTNDRFDLSLRRSEVLVARWDEPGYGQPRTNIGTSYADVFPSLNDGVGCDVDGTGKNDFRFYVSWNKNFGSGTHSIRIKDQSTTDVLAEISNAVNGRNVTTGSIPAYFQDNVRSIKLQAKSTVSTDDPEFRGASLHFK